MVLVAGMAEGDEGVVGGSIWVMAEVIVLAEEGLGEEVVGGVFHVGVGSFSGLYFGEVLVGEGCFEG